MLPVLLAVSALFVILLFARIGGAKRRDWLHRWPALVLAFGAAYLLGRGQIWFALGLLAAAAVIWFFKPERYTPKPAKAKAPVDSRDAEARAMLGVGLHATAEQIRAAYRSKMAMAHPDRGGSHADAARLTAARDRLLKR